MRIKTPPCPFGKVLMEILKEKGIGVYDIERRHDVSAVTIHRFLQCMRFPSPFKNSNAFSIVELARILGANKEQKKKLYKALIETFYPELVEYLPEVKEEKLTDDYVKELLYKIPKGMKWKDVYEKVPEPTLRKIRNLRSDISLLNIRDMLKEYLNVLNINNKQKAEILYYFLKKKGAEEEFLKLIREP